MLAPYLQKRVSVVTVDGRHILGVLHAADQLLNLVLKDGVERELAPHQDSFSYLQRQLDIVAKADGGGSSPSAISMLHVQAVSPQQTNSNRGASSKKSGAEEEEEGESPLRLHEEKLGVLMLRGADVVSVGLVDVYEEAKYKIQDWKGFDMPPSKVTCQ